MSEACNILIELNIYSIFGRIYYKKDSNSNNTSRPSYYKMDSISTNRHILYYKKDSAEIRLAFSSLFSVYGFFHYGRFTSTVFCYFPRVEACMQCQSMEFRQTSCIPPSWQYFQPQQYLFSKQNHIPVVLCKVRYIEHLLNIVAKKNGSFL
jgi:hypothetical protein